MRKKITISGTGCALADNLYTNIDFSTIEFKKYLSINHADGGLSPGRLVFTEEFENFTGDKFENLLKEISGNKEPESFNIGGPSIVSLINASQLLFDYDVEIRFYGATGKDDIGRKIQESLKSVKINFSNYKAFDSPSPFTDVFSDPNYDHGRGERIFVNNIGAAWKYTPKHLNDAFFKSDITVFGGTALVPNIHDNLTTLLSKAKRHGSFTIVNTEYDFRNEKKYPNKNW
ncbi:MAG: carbohydrate kinase family protein, partial [Cyclobacteriaceae bacterium]|nr:carbohydrate kinase family protein [Cyclobacteriaceae bacterium]